MSVLPEIANPLTGGKVVAKNVTYEEYSHQVVDRGHEGYRMGRSDLLDFARCPHKWLVGYTSEDTEATEWGTLFESLVMFPEDVENRFAVTPATYQSSGMKCPKCGGVTDSKSCRKCGVDRVPVVIEKPWDFNSTVCQAWKEEHSGKHIVKGEVFTQAQNAVKFFFACEQLSDLIRVSDKQVMVEARYEDLATGIAVPIKTLIDLAPRVSPSGDGTFDQSLADLKTTRSAEPFAWSRDVFTYGLHVQAALYLDAWNSACPDSQRIDFRHAISESGPPWEPACRILSQDFITLGRMKYLDALKRYCQCLATGHWPGYDTEEAGTCLDGWLLTDCEAWMVNR